MSSHKFWINKNKPGALKKSNKLKSQYLSQFDALVTLSVYCWVKLKNVPLLVFLYYCASPCISLSSHSVDTVNAQLREQRTSWREAEITYPIHHRPVNPVSGHVIHVWRNIIMICMLSVRVTHQLCVKTRLKELNKTQCVNLHLSDTFHE